jgi:peptidoglycan/xylan/chitin deacetylase (PgdA/CDA1 family)
MRFLYNWIQRCFPNLQFYISSSDSWQLTFDDGPSPNTIWLLDLLDQHKIKARFFCIGKNIEQYPSYFQAIIDRGHQVGYHSYGHINAWRQCHKDFIEDFEKCEALFLSKYYRPPYGKFTWSMYRYLKRKNIKLMLWDVLTEDWKQNINPKEKIIKKIKAARGGSIFVFHDNEKAYENLKVMLPIFFEYNL